MKHSILLHLLLFLPTYHTCDCDDTSTYRNIALRGKATQSSRYSGDGDVYGDACNAIDGNRDPLFYHGSCSHTKKECNPWWRVDLLDCYIIERICITNRKDCCEERLQGAEIHISKTQDTDNANTRVATISSIPAGGSDTICIDIPEGMGQFVTVLIPRSEYLTLCEVEVYGYPVPTDNVAIYGRASQSSVYLGTIAYNAIDGNREANWAKGSCSHTDNDVNPWWRLELGREYKVFNVTVTNRSELPERLNGAEIRIGCSLVNNGNNNPRCATISSMGAGVTETFQCHGMDGCYVNIVIPGRAEYLTLCEVEVCASKLDKVSKCKWCKI